MKLTWIYLVLLFIFIVGLSCVVAYCYYWGCKAWMWCRTLCKSNSTATPGSFPFPCSLMALGVGGIRSCTMAFTADQMNNPENPQNEKIMKSLFNWYYVSVGISITISMIFMVHMWIMVLGIPVGIMFFSTILFFLGSSIYVKGKPNKSLRAGFAQVIVAAWKNRHLPMPPKNWHLVFPQWL